MVHSISRSNQTLTIEKLLHAGISVSSIAKQFAVTRGRVQQIKRRLHATSMIEGYQVKPFVSLEYSATKSCDLEMPTPQLQLSLSPKVMHALVEAVRVCNHRSLREAKEAHEEPEFVSPQEYVEELLVGHLASGGFLKK